jgi:hypothetical protein
MSGTRQHTREGLVRQTIERILFLESNSPLPTVAGVFCMFKMESGHDTSSSLNPLRFLGRIPWGFLFPGAIR